MNSGNINPFQREGSSTDIVESIVLPSEYDARHHFEAVKQRLLNVSDWGKISKGSSSEFKLTTPDGEEFSGNARVGDFFKIKIPAPGPEAGSGYDWVKVHSVKNEVDASTDSEFLAMTVKPAKDPTINKVASAHFFSSEASSTFVVTRKGKKITAEVHGRNESPNTEKTGIRDTVRNTIVAIGAMLGFSDIQWKALAKGLVSKD